MGLGQVAQLQLVAPAQAVALLGVLLDQDAAGARVAHVQHHVHGDGPMHVVPGVADQLELRQPDPMPDQGEQVQIVGVMAEAGLLGVDVLRRQPQRGAGVVRECLLDPARHPGQLREPANLARPVGEGEGRAGLDVGRARGEVLGLLGAREDARVERQGQAVGLPVRVASSGDRATRRARAQVSGPAANWRGGLTRSRGTASRRRPDAAPTRPPGR